MKKIKFSELLKQDNVIIHTPKERQSHLIKFRNDLKYVFIGTEKDLIDNGFTYRPHYDDYAKGLYDDDAETQQDFYVQINAKTKEVGIYIQFLSKHGNQTLIEDGMFFLIQENIFPLYFNVIKELIEKGIIKENE